MLGREKKPKSLTELNSDRLNDDFRKCFLGKKTGSNQVFLFTLFEMRKLENHNIVCLAVLRAPMYHLYSLCLYHLHKVRNDPSGILLMTRMR